MTIIGGDGPAATEASHEISPDKARCP
jgi:hypothetical protein